MAASVPPQLQLIAQAQSVPSPNGSVLPLTNAGSFSTTPSAQLIVLYVIIAVSAIVLILLVIVIFITLRKRRRRMELYEASQISFGPPVGRRKSWWTEVAQTGIGATVLASGSKYKEEDTLSLPTAVERPVSARLSAATKSASFGREFLRSSTGHTGRRASVLRSSISGGLGSVNPSQTLALVDERLDEQQQPNGGVVANGSVDSVFDPHSSPVPAHLQVAAPSYSVVDQNGPQTPVSPVTPVPIRDTFAIDAHTTTAYDADLGDLRVRADSIVADRRFSLTTAQAHTPGRPGPPWQKLASQQHSGTDPGSDLDRQDTPPPIL